MTTPERREERKKQLMEQCFECYCEHGLTGTGRKDLEKACGMTGANLYTYFDSVDQMIAESTAYCMSKVEEEFMALAPTGPEDVVRFLRESPYWTAKEHGKKYRFMYQVYSNPKFVENGKAFFEGVNRRYAEYARRLEPSIGIPAGDIEALIYTFVRASVHYAMFEDEPYLQAQLQLLIAAFLMMSRNYQSAAAPAGERR